MPKQLLLFFIFICTSINEDSTNSIFQLSSSIFLKSLCFVQKFKKLKDLITGSHFVLNLTSKGACSDPFLSKRVTSEARSNLKNFLILSILSKIFKIQSSPILSFRHVNLLLVKFISSRAQLLKCSK